MSSASLAFLSGRLMAGFAQRLIFADTSDSFLNSMVFIDGVFVKFIFCFILFIFYFLDGDSCLKVRDRSSFSFSILLASSLFILVFHINHLEEWCCISNTSTFYISKR